MKKRELRKLIREELQKLNELNDYVGLVDAIYEYLDDNNLLGKGLNVAKKEVLKAYKQDNAIFDYHVHPDYEYDIKAVSRAVKKAYEMNI